MSGMLPPLDKHPALDPSQDFYRLRREGIGHIQQAGSAQWTDYNLHDPGITLLEALCYAITDVGYRIGWRIEDILAPAEPPADPTRPYPGQAFFTAREILTVNPTTANDLRRVLIDLPGVRNAWAVCKTRACEASYWAYCDLAGQLVLQYPQPSSPPNPAVEVWALGLYETLLELDNDPELGDLNDRMVAHATVHYDGEGAHPVTMEVRFPEPSLLDREAWRAFLQGGAFTVELVRLGATRTYNVLDLPAPSDQDDYLREQWDGVFYLDLRVALADAGQVFVIENATLRVFADDAVRQAASAQAWRDLFADAGPGGFVARYRRKAVAVAQAVADAKAALRGCRGLGEDYGVVSCIGVEDVAVCADVEVRPDADIERVQAAIWFELERYMAPPVPFRSLRELRAKGVAVEDIFDGPALANGFIEEADLDAAALVTALRASDIVHRLMDIDGVVAVSQLRMTKYDDEGNAVAGAADPEWVDGQPAYAPGKTSAAWLLAIRPRHQPRLYFNASRFLFYKDGLPFRARMDEAIDTLNQLRGEADRPRHAGAPDDLPVPPGRYRHPEDYFPVQYSFPLAYGIGPEGLPPGATPARKAQAGNLKAYLMVFEQLLGNALAQLAHTADLFSLDPAVARTRFVKAFDATAIKGIEDIADPAKLEAAAVGTLVETPEQFLARRNAFLDHLLARFGEQFGEYALLLTQASGAAVARPRLIESKLAFLRRYPALSHDRAKAFDYRAPPGKPDNRPGVQERVHLLLGYPDLDFDWTVQAPVAGTYPVGYVLRDGGGAHRLEGTVAVPAASEAAARQAARRLLLERMVLAEAYTVEPAAGGAFALVLQDATAAPIGHGATPLANRDDALALRDALVGWSASARMLVVEHVLLRPKFVGDALYPACCDDDCATCGSADPYSFRLTYVMPGWAGPYTANLDLRRYADRTLQRETPSHLLAKTCWVGNDGYVENPCDEVVDRLADLLATDGRTADDAPPAWDDACADAHAIYHLFSDAFAAWFADRQLALLHDDALAAGVGAALQAVAAPPGGAVVLAPALWDAVRALMTAHFAGIARRGWQFERFEEAWYAWLEANAAIDWTEERLAERVEAILAADLQSSAPGAATLCDCARRVVADYGAAFHDWMRDNLAAGRAFDDFAPFAEPAVALCADHGFPPGTQPTVAALLRGRYAAYARPSYALWLVVTLLAGLRNTYPGATLHDCDEAGDVHPVRLDNTALGNYPRRTAP